MDPDTVDTLLRQYLENVGLLEPDQITCWKIETSKLSGRGVVATRAIGVDELVYSDKAMLQGPRAYSKYLPLCVGCHRSGCTLFPCEAGCGLPVCSDACQDSPLHKPECAYLCELQPNCGSTWSLELLQAVVPIRALMLPPELRRIFYSVQCHEAAQHGREVDLLKKNVKEVINADDEEYMRRVCRAMDTNSFETAIVHGDSSTSLRALFPLGALTNHQCVPNTRHLVNSSGELLSYATKPIAMGEEITMSYTELLWDTTLRRQFLRATKHFACQCPRCCDVTECGTYLGALFCADNDCLGKLLPVDTMNFNSPWTCDECGLTIKSKQISFIRSGIMTAVRSVLYESPRRMLNFIKRDLNILIPESNYVMMEMMFRIVSLFGRAEGFVWDELSEEELSIKKEYCQKLIASLDKLNSGDCTKKGLILYELHCTNVEKSKRISRKQKEESTFENNKVELSNSEQILKKAMQILKDDIVAPSDYLNIYTARSSRCTT